VNTMRAMLTATALLLISCGSTGPVQDYASLNEGGEPLVSAFNADSGTVRAIYLASPT
jgi:hypothetical protein